VRACVRACVNSMKLYNFQRLYPMSLNITKKFPIKTGKLPNPRLLHKKLNYIQDLQFVTVIFVFVQNKFIYFIRYQFSKCKLWNKTYVFLLNVF